MTNLPLLLAPLVLLTACGGAVPSAHDASNTPESPTPEAPLADATPVRATLTPAECEQRGGRVVFDIGDGAIHRPDYRCPGSGEPPIGRIQVEPGQPMPIEGAVCCL